MKKVSKKNTILIVEDELSLRRILVDKFFHEGFELIEASDGVAGLSKAKKHHPDLILLDILLPKMDGITMMEKLRKEEWGKSVPIILLTNLNLDDERMHDIVKNEPAFYLVKSEWRLEDIVKKVKELL